MPNANNLEHPGDAGTELVAAIPKDRLRSLFYLYAGRPDSRIKVYTEAAHLSPHDFLELNQCVERKLDTHQIDASATTVKVSFESSHFNEFGTWLEFESHHWQQQECIEEVVVKWDFMVDIPGYKAPQRHTLIFRVSRDLKPGRVLQMIASGNPDEFDQVDLFSAPAFCRVDFINATLSKELINVVSEWYDGRKSPKLIADPWFWFKSKRQLVATILDYWLFVSCTLLLISALLWASNYWYPEGAPAHLVGAAVLLGVALLRLAQKGSQVCAGLVFKSLAALEGARVVFEFTSGDKKRLARLEDTNRQLGRKFVLHAAWNILLNILAAIVCTRLIGI